mgnify:CR=1 FL=1
MQGYRKLLLALLDNAVRARQVSADLVRGEFALLEASR